MKNDLNFYDIFILIIVFIVFGCNMYSCGKTRALTTTACKPGAVLSFDTDNSLVICKMPDGKMEVRKY